MEIISTTTLGAHLGVISGRFSTCDSSQVEIVRESITGVSPRIGYTKYYRWSVDGKNWSPRIATGGTKFLEVPSKTPVWIEVEYEVNNPYGVDERITVHSVVVQDKGVKTPTTISNNSNNIQEVITRAVSSTTAQLNSWIQNTLSTPVTYWNITGIDSTRDVILNEFGLYAGSPGVCLGVHVKDNVIPTEKPEYKDWGLDWESFEVEVSVETFKATLGDKATPTVGDFLYISTVNRLYSVLSYYTERGVDGRPLVYVLKLSTYEGKSSILNTPETTEALSKSTLSPEVIFSEELEAEFLDSIDPVNTSTKTITTDGMRSVLSPLITIKESTLLSGKTRVFTHCYSWERSTMNAVGVVYAPEVSLSENGGLSWGAWVKLGTDSITVNQDGNKIAVDHPLLGIGTTLNTGGVIVDGEAGAWIVNQNTTGQVTTIPTISLGTLGDSMQIVVQSNTVSILKGDYSELYSVNHAIPTNAWYLIVVTINNAHGYCGMYGWTPGGTRPDLSQEFPLRSKIMLDNATAYLRSGVGEISGIRIFNKAIPTKHHRSYYGSETVPVPSTIIIKDSADPLYNSRKYDEGVLPRTVGDGTPL